MYLKAITILGFIFLIVISNGNCAFGSTDHFFNGHYKIAWNETKVREKSFSNELTSNLMIQGESVFLCTKKDLCYLTGGGLLTAVLIKNDVKIDCIFSSWKNKNPELSACSAIITELGGNYGLGFSALFVGYSYLFKDEKAIHTSRLLGQALITSTVWTRLIKLGTGRKRPSDFYNQSGTTWNGPLAQFSEKMENFQPSNFDSFPSGHTATAFAIATVLAIEYSDHPLVPILAYTIASTVGVTRMLEHQHWSSDVLVGSAIGYLCSRQICHQDKGGNSITQKATNKKTMQSMYFINYSNKICMANFSLSF